MLYEVITSRDNGLEESRFVFLQHNRLAERFARLDSGAIFVIGETGFGSGLNFLATCQLGYFFFRSPFLNRGHNTYSPIIKTGTQYSFPFLTGAQENSPIASACR